MMSYSNFLFEDNTENEEINYPDGVYISVKMRDESLIALKNYADKYLNGYDFNLDQHCTLIYSKKEQKELIESKEYDAIGTFLHFSKFGKEGETLVAELNCDLLVNRNKELVKKYGFVSDYDEYKPHFTLVYDAQDIDINSLPAIDFALNFYDETVEPLNENWKNTKDKDNESDSLVGKALAKMKKDEEAEQIKLDKKQVKEGFSNIEYVYRKSKIMNELYGYEDSFVEDRQKLKAFKSKDNEILLEMARNNGIEDNSKDRTNEFDKYKNTNQMNKILSNNFL